MKSKKSSLLLKTTVVAGLTVTTLSSAAPELPRGADVHELAGNCAIGSFPQTTKAGPYNSLCQIMQDPEKCLGLIKQHFSFNGEKVLIYPAHSGQKEKMEFCMEVLKRELGL